MSATVQEVKLQGICDVFKGKLYGIDADWFSLFVGLLYLIAAFYQSDVRLSALHTIQDIGYKNNGDIENGKCVQYHELSFLKRCYNVIW